LSDCSASLVVQGSIKSAKGKARYALNSAFSQRKK